MINWNDIKNLDLTDFDLGKVDMTRLDVRKIDMSKFDLPEFDMARFDVRNVDVSKFDLPKFDLPELPDFDVPVDRVAAMARDAAYVGVGAVVVTAQKVDERRREMTDQVTAQVRKIVDAVA